MSSTRQWLLENWARLRGMTERLLREWRQNPTSVTSVAQALPLTTRASVLIPALNEARRIAEVVAFALADPATAEVIVIDDSSIDDTAELARQAGATVITSSMLGKGASMHDGLLAAQCELLVYLDGDLAGLRSGIISDLCQPLLRGEADFVKARFGRDGGRVTELTAKPMLKVFFPEIAQFSQPLGGIVAGRKTLLQALRFEDGYGVDVGLFLDAYLKGARLAEVDIGGLEHESQALQDLTAMANEVGRVIFQRARAAGRLHVDQITAMYESQRQAASEFAHVLARRKGRERLLLLGMDQVVTPTLYVLELARVTGQEAAVQQALMEPDLSKRQARIAALFRYVHKSKFEDVARTLPIRPELVAVVNQLRRRGFMVGLVSDSYFVAAEIIRRRIFSDFALAHLVQFDNDVCTGQLQINPAFCSEADPHNVNAAHVLRRFRADLAAPAIAVCWVVGNPAQDLALMQLADRSFALAPLAGDQPAPSGVALLSSFNELLELLPNHEVVVQP